MKHIVASHDWVHGVPHGLSNWCNVEHLPLVVFVFVVP